jgi:hypothetical protein
MERVADLVNAIEVVRSQIEQLQQIVEDPHVKRAADELDKKLIAVEQNLVDLRLTGRAGRSWGSRLASNLAYLARQLAASDFKPTDQQLEVQKLHEELLSKNENQFNAIRDRELTTFNELLRRRKVPHIITTAARPTS